MKNQIKAVIYCRVSTGKQMSEGTGLDSQESLCKGYASKKGYKIEEVFLEEGVSGGLFDRPAMKRLMAFLDKYPTENYVIIFDDLKRFARDIEVHLRLRAELKSRGATIESPNFNFEDSPEGRFSENVSAATAQYERESNRRQVIQKMQSRLDRGYWVFRSPPPGLRYQKDPIHGKLLVKEEPICTILKTAIEKYANDEFQTQEEVRQYILHEFKSNGIKRAMSADSVKGVLTELLYTGFIEHLPWNITRRKGAHEGFISIETYNFVQGKLNNKAKSAPRKDYSDDFPLRGFTICDSCGKPLTAAWCKGRNSHYPKYWCKNKLCSFGSTVPKETIEGDFLALLGNVKLKKPVIDLATAVLLEAWNEEKQASLSVIKEAEKEKKFLDTQIQNLSTRISITTDSTLVTHYEKQLKDLLQKRGDLDDNHLNHVSYSEEEFRTASEVVFETLKYPVRMWKKPKYTSRSTIIRMYFADRLEYNIQGGFRTPTLEPAINVINGLGTTNSCNVEMGGVEPPSAKVFYKRCS